MENILAFDIGTSGIKAAVISEEFSILARAYEKYDIFVKNSAAEQNPNDWYNAMLMCIDKLRKYIKKYKVESVVLTGSMQNIILIDNKSEALRNAVMYSDMRARQEYKYIHSVISEDEIFSITKNNAGLTSLAPKLLYLKNKEKSNFKKTEHILIGAADYVFHKLTGLFKTDYTNASTTGIFNTAKKIWSDKILGIIGIDKNILPEVSLCKKHAITNNGFLDFLGVKDLYVYSPIGDAASNTIGALYMSDTDYSAYFGTSGWVSSVSNKITENKGIFNLVSPDGKNYIKIAPMLLTGGNINWVVKLFDNFQSKTPYKQFDKLAERKKSSLSNVIYLPYLAGERSPFFDENVKGAFIGLTQETDKSDLCKAVSEGICFALRNISESTGFNYKKHSISLYGGGSKSEYIGSLFSTILKTDIKILGAHEDTGLIGAAVIAKNKKTNAENKYISKTYKPNLKMINHYDKLYTVFIRCYPALSEIFSQIVSIKNKLKGDAYL